MSTAIKARPGNPYGETLTLPPAKATGRDLKKVLDSGTWAKGVDWKRIKRAVDRRSRSRDLRKTA